MSLPIRFQAILLAALTACASRTVAQESSTGVELRATITGLFGASNELTEAPRSGAPVVGGFRTIFYPTWTISDRWFVSGAGQFSTRPFYYQDFSLAGYGAKGNILQVCLNYARIWDKASFVFRAGEMPTAFGLFPLHYDDTDNPLVDLPIEYGYYHAPVSIYAVTAAQIDLTKGKWDSRVQFANSSPANPQTPTAEDQYGNWVTGLGYTIKQGFHVGLSGYRGPYLDRHYDSSASEYNHKLSRYPATGLGVEVNWAHRHTNLEGEVQQFVMPNPSGPEIHESVGYGEVKQVLDARWYIAARAGYTSNHTAENAERVEAAVGFRPNRVQLVKISFETEHYGSGNQQFENILAIQLITSLHKSLARR
jgi:hypothetical protein